MSSFFNFLKKNKPADLYPHKSFTEKYEAELILLAGACIILLVLIFAFFVVGQMDPYTNGVLA